MLVLLSLAYCTGNLDPTLIKRADKQLFGAARRTSWLPAPHSRHMIKEIVLVFSDQQIATGLGILIAGFVQQATSDL